MEITKEISILDFFPPDDGSIDQYYGKIGSGKTYIATANVVADLMAGKVVYANWKINWKGYDERNDPFKLFLGLLGLKKTFIKIPQENFHFLPVNEHFFDTIARLTDCVIYLDEGHIAFDSYRLTKMDIRDRATILHTRHFNRRIVIISQRPTAIHVVLRANVSRFYKCECEPSRFLFWTWNNFTLTEFQEMIGETVDETKPESVVSYRGKKEIYEMFDTKYLRGDMPESQPNLAQVFRLPWNEIAEFWEMRKKRKERKSFERNFWKKQKKVDEKINRL